MTLTNRLQRLYDLLYSPSLSEPFSPYDTALLKLIRTREDIAKVKGFNIDQTSSNTVLKPYPNPFYHLQIV